MVLFIFWVYAVFLFSYIQKKILEKIYFLFSQWYVRSNWGWSLTEALPLLSRKMLKHHGSRRGPPHVNIWASSLIGGNRKTVPSLGSKNTSSLSLRVGRKICWTKLNEKLLSKPLYRRFQTMLCSFWASQKNSDPLLVPILQTFGGNKVARSMEFIGLRLPLTLV